MSFHSIVAAFTLTLSGAFAGEANFTTYFQPCSSWNYDFQANAYVCRFLESRISVYESRDVDQLIRSLENKIDQLEARVKALESGK